MEQFGEKNSLKTLTLFPHRLSPPQIKVFFCLLDPIYLHPWHILIQFPCISIAWWCIMIPWDWTHGCFYWFPFDLSFNFRRFYTEPRLPLCGPSLLICLSCVRETIQILRTGPIEEAEAFWAVRGDYSTGKSCMDLPACVEVYWKVIWTLSMSKRKFYVWYQWNLCSSKFRITKNSILVNIFCFPC